MGLFKKRVKPVVAELKCPVEECSFICYDHTSLKRHIEWKHPDLPADTMKSD